MPKVLNVEKLEIKFSSLTRARDSITALSSWIMRHSEFCDGIVEEWLAGLSKDFNALVMFYVANDVIINCGKKRVPQYRIAFSKVLEKAMSLPSVKKISKEISRVLNIWHERDIYDKEFCEVLKNRVNSTETVAETLIKKSSPAEVELVETDIIANYKQKDLFAKLMKLKAIEEEVSEKEEILSYAEEPEKPNLALIGIAQCQSLLRKVDRYCETIKSSLRLVENEVIVRNTVLKELKNTTTFYSVQREDVKKVAHAYRIYGKKIKNVVKNLSEKRETLPFNHKDPPFFSDNDISSPRSPDDTFSPVVCSTNLVKGSPTTFQSPNNDQSNLQPDNVIGFTTGSSFFSTLQDRNEGMKLFESLFEEQHETSTPTSSNKYANASSPIPDTLHGSTPTNVASNASLSPDNSKSIDKCIETPQLPSSYESSDHDIAVLSKVNSIKTEITSPLSCTSSSHKSPNDNMVSDPKLEKGLLDMCHGTSDHQSPRESTFSLLKTPENRVAITSSCTVDKLPEDTSSRAVTLSTDVTNKICKPKTPDSAPVISAGEKKESKNKMDIELEDVDQVLEKSLKRDNIKRKIELLLKTRGKKHCIDLTQGQDYENSPDGSTSRESFQERMDVVLNPFDKPVDILAVSNSSQHNRHSTNTNRTSATSSFDGNHKQLLETLSPLNSISSNSAEVNVGECIAITNLDGSEAFSNSSSKDLVDSNTMVLEDFKDVVGSVKDENSSKLKQIQMDIDIIAESHNEKPEVPVPFASDNSSSLHAESSLENCLSISTEQLRHILAKNEKNCDSHDIVEPSLKKSPKICSVADVNAENDDSFFANFACSSSSSDKSNQIPGLEISMEPEQEESLIEIITTKKSEVSLTAHISKVNDNELRDAQPIITKVNDNELRDIEKEMQVEKSEKEILNFSVKNSVKADESPLSTSNVEIANKEIKLSLNEVDLTSSLDNSLNVGEELENNKNCIPSNLESNLTDNTLESCDISVSLNHDNQTTNESVVLNTCLDTDNRSRPKRILPALQNVLEYISRNKMSHLNPSKSLDYLPKQSLKLPPFMTLENCLRIYGALRRIPTTLENPDINNKIEAENQNHGLINVHSVSKPVGLHNFVTPDFCTTTNSLHGPILSTCDSSISQYHTKSIENLNPVNSNVPNSEVSLAPCVSEDDLEIADMDCDSE